MFLSSSSSLSLSLSLHQQKCVSLFLPFLLSLNLSLSNGINEPQINPQSKLAIAKSKLIATSKPIPKIKTHSKITPTIFMERKKKSQLLQPPPPPSSPTTKITFSPQIIPSMGEQTQTKPHYTPTPPPQPSTLPSQSSKPPHQLRP